MQHFKTMLACLAATLFFSCSKKDDTAKSEEEPPQASYWILNGNKIIPTEVIAHPYKKGFSFRAFKNGTEYAACIISFTDSLVKSGEYSIGQLVSPTKQAQILTYIEPAGTDSVFHSRNIETAKIKVTFVSDTMKVIEIPEIWVRNPHDLTDSVKLSGKLIQIDTAQ